MAESCAAWCWRWRIPASWPSIRYRLKTRMRCGCIWMRSIKTGFTLVSAPLVIHISDSLEKVQRCRVVFFCCCCGFSPLATFPPDVTFRACCICADLSGSDPQFLLCAFLMMCLCHAERWAEMKQSGIVSVVCTLVFEKLVSLSHLDSLFLFFHFILVVWRIGTLLHTGKNGQYKGNP